MGKMNVVLSDELEKRFRKVIFERKGMKKGNISEALEEAIRCWINHYESEGKHYGKNENNTRENDKGSEATSRDEASIFHKKRSEPS